MKKIFSCLLVLMLILSSGGNIQAAPQKQMKEETNTFCMIDELYNLRSKLISNYDYFEEEIEMIDKRLETLGVEEISQNEVEAKLGIGENAIQPCIDVSSNSDIKWTSTRETYVYRGKWYELQIIRGVPASENSSLFNSDLTFENINPGVGTAAMNALTVTVRALAGYLPKVGGQISTALTVYDVFNGVVSGLQKTTSLSGVTFSYHSSVGSSYLYVFVKYSGSVDTGNQILGYCGNVVEYYTAINHSKPIWVNGDLKPNVKTEYVEGTITSPFYDSYRTVASNVFWEYKNGNPNERSNYETGYFWVKMINRTEKLEAPYAFPY